MATEPAAAPIYPAAIWRGDIDALAFRPAGHAGSCVVHRRAFRVLVGRDAGREECLAFYDAHRGAFHSAARAKIARRAIRAEASFHLTSRDVRRDDAAHLSPSPGVEKPESGGYDP